MDARNIEKYDVEAWVEDLSGLYYGYGNGDDLTYDPRSRDGEELLRQQDGRAHNRHRRRDAAQEEQVLGGRGMRARHVRLLACDDASLPCWERDVR